MRLIALSTTSVMEFRIVVHHQPGFLDEVSIRAFHSMLAAIDLGEVDRAELLLVLLDEVLEFRKIPSSYCVFWPFEVELAGVVAGHDDSPDQSDRTSKLSPASLSLPTKISTYFQSL